MVKNKSPLSGQKFTGGAKPFTEGALHPRAPPGGYATNGKVEFKRIFNSTNINSGLIQFLLSFNKNFIWDDADSTYKHWYMARNTRNIWVSKNLVIEWGKIRIKELVASEKQR